MAAGASAWAAIFDGVSAAAAGTAKTVGLVKAASNRKVKVTEVSIGFVGAVVTAKPVLVELCHIDNTGAGSGSSSVTPINDDKSDAQTVQATAAKGFTSEPTTQTVIRRWRVHPQTDQIVQLPLGREVVSGVNMSVGLRVTFESGETTTTVDGYMDFEE